MNLRLPRGVQAKDIVARSEARHVERESPQGVRRRIARNNRAKGKGFEKVVAQAIATLIELPLTDVQRARAGTDEVDVGLSAEARRRFPFWTECKNHKNPGKIQKWLEQAEKACAEQANGELEPIVVFKTYRVNEVYATLKWDTLARLLSAIAVDARVGVIVKKTRK